MTMISFIKDWQLKRHQEKRLKPTLTGEQIQEKIALALFEQKPFFTGRVGWVESVVLGHLVKKRPLNSSLKEQLEKNSGVFPLTDQELEFFQSSYLSALKEIDLIGFMEVDYNGWLIDKFAPQAQRSFLSDLEPFFASSPWSARLAGKKVLVIHPFVKSILRQYAVVREKLFAKKEILPPFELKVIQSPQTVVSENRKYATWHETLNSLTEGASKQEFDVAIIGCGAYGFPLAAAIKKMGKVALHLGGVTQLLFGIRGERWANMPQFQSLFNEHWVRPLPSERHARYKEIEKGCYW